MHEGLDELRERIEAGGAPKYHEANAAKGKLFARERIALLVDEGSFVEDGLLRQRAGRRAARRRRDHRRGHGRRPPGLPDGQRLHGQGGLAGARGPSRRSSGSSSGRTPTGVPMVYLVDSAGARITDQVDLFPGRRGAGQHLLQPGPRLRLDPAGVRAVRPVAPPAAPTSRPSATWSRWSTATPRCTSAPTAWSRWSPARRPRSRRWAARGSTVPSPASATSSARPRTRRSTWSGATCPTCRRTGSGQPPAVAGRGRAPEVDLAALVPASERQAFDMRRFVKGLLDEGSYFEIQALWARELTVGFGRLDGEVVGVVANNSLYKGGVLFVDSADKATRFVQLCDAFNVPLLFLSDVPGLHGRHRGGEAGHHPARRQDDHRDLRGDRAEDLRGGPQGVRRRPLRDGRARASSRTPRSRCPPRRSR